MSASPVNNNGPTNDLASAVVADAKSGATKVDGSMSAWNPAPRRRRRPVGMFLAIGWLGLIVMLAVGYRWLPFDGFADTSNDPLLSPGLRWDEPLGTDNIGRSVLSRVIAGARVSLLVSAGAAFIGIVVGSAIGLVAGFFRGRAEVVFDLLITSLLAFPPLILLIALAAILTPGTTTLVIALGVLAIPLFARISRANTLTFAERDFVLSSRAMGARSIRILTREILPNAILPVLSYAFIVMASLMVAEGSLSFLGLGIPPPTPSWGGMINAGRGELADHPHLVLGPGAAFVLTIFSLNYLGDWFRARVARRSDS